MKKKLINSIITIKYRGLFVFFSAIYYNFLSYLHYNFFNKKLFKKKIYNNLMYLDNTDPGISRTLILFGKREIEHKYIIDKVLTSNMCILDIGSNIGYYALIELKIINNGYLIAVEPSPSNFELLNKNIILNNYSNYETHNIAISDSDSTKDFYLSFSSNLNTFHKTEDKRLDLSGKSIKVKTNTILSISKERKIDFIRMDVEGHEVSILKSLIEYINKTNFRPKILFEPHLSRYNSKNDIISPLKKLFSIGYKVKYIGSSWQQGSLKIEKKDIYLL